MIETKNLNFAEIEELAFKALTKTGASEKSARSLAIATAQTEADGVSSHGLLYIPIYCEHIKCGKVDGKATPTIKKTKASVINVDAKTGFAHLAIDMGFQMLIPTAKQQGVAVLSINNSYNCGVLGYHTKRLANSNLVGIGFTNAPASIAPSGGNKPVVGTNPLSIAVPGNNDYPAILIDQSASVVAKSEIMKYAREEKNIPEGWALDAKGNPTTNPNDALKGSMSPSGGYKGVGVALFTEIMAAALTGATLGINASPFSGTVGGPPKTGQFFIAIDPEATSNGNFFTNINELTQVIRVQKNSHIPGEGRNNKNKLAKSEGVNVNLEIIKKIEKIINS